MIIQFDDPFNLVLPSDYRCTVGILMKEQEKQVIDLLKDKYGFEEQLIPRKKVNCLYGNFPYRIQSSISFGEVRFQPACVKYLMQRPSRSRNFKSVQG